MDINEKIKKTKQNLSKTLLATNGERKLSACLLEINIAFKVIEREVRKDAFEEMILVSDKIESEHSTLFDEWRAFKHFRNTLRDRIRKLNKKKYVKRTIT